MPSRKTHDGPEQSVPVEIESERVWVQGRGSQGRRTNLVCFDTSFRIGYESLRAAVPPEWMLAIGCEGQKLDFGSWMPRGGTKLLGLAPHTPCLPPSLVSAGCSQHATDCSAVTPVVLQGQARLLNRKRLLFAWRAP